MLIVLGAGMWQVPEGWEPFSNLRATAVYQGKSEIGGSVVTPLLYNSLWSEKFKDFQLFVYEWCCCQTKQTELLNSRHTRQSVNNLCIVHQQYNTWTY